MKKLDLVMILFGFSLWIPSAMAYIDPGTGSVVIQSVIAAVTGGLFVLKTYWYKIKAKLFSKNKTVESEANDN